MLTLKVKGLRKRGVDGDYQTKEMATVLDVPESIAHLYATYNIYARGKKGIVYAIDRAHAQHIAEYYAAHGVRCAVIDAKTQAGERRRIVEEYKGKSFRTNETHIPTVGLQMASVSPSGGQQGGIDVLINTEDGNRQSRVQGFLGDRVLVSADRGIGYQAVYADGRRGECFLLRPKEATVVPDWERPGLRSLSREIR